MCNKTNTTTQKNEPNPNMQAAYNSLINLGGQIAGQPYQEYSGARVAGFTPDQQRAFQLTEQAQGMGLPYINSAAGYLDQSAQSVFPSVQKYNAGTLADYQNPWQQQVVDTTLNAIRRNNQMQQSDLAGRSIGAGSSPFLGDRAGVAAAELARNQNETTNKTLADLMSSGFNNAQNALFNQQQLQLQGGNADSARALAAGNAYSGLGSTAQGLTLQGAQALLNNGSLQQQNAQQQLDVPYQNFLAQQQYPYNQANFLANLIYGMPNPGGTTTTTSPGPSFLSQLIGLGTAGLGFARGFGGTSGGYGLGGSVDEDNLAAGGFGRYAEGGTPKIDVDKFRISPDDQWKMEMHPLAGADSYINAPPQLTAPAPRVIDYPPNIRAAFNAFPRFKVDVKDADIDTTPWPAWAPWTPWSGSGELNRPQMAFAEGGDVPDASETPDTRGGFGRRLASRFDNPLVWAGLGMMGGTSPFPLTNIGSGALQGLQAFKASHPDQNPIILKDGPTLRIYHPDTGEIIDTHIPTTGANAEKWKDVIQGGLKGQINELTGEFKPYPGQDASPERKFQKIGTDDYGQDIFGWVDPATGKITRVDANGKPIATSDSTSSITAPSSTNPGPSSAYEALPDSQKRIADAVYEGRMPMPGGMALKTPYWQRIMEAANDRALAEGDPTGFDAVKWLARAQTRKAFAPSSSPNAPGGAIVSGNTAIQHLGQLWDEAKNLGNWEGIPFLSYYANQIKNASVRGTKEGVALSAFQSIRDKYVEEATKFYRGTGGSLADIERDIGVLDEAKSLPELQEAIKKQMHLMESKISALQDQWTYTMGDLTPDYPIIQPKSRQVIDKIYGIPDDSAASIPAKAIEYLKQHPDFADQFDLKYGQGMAEQILGAP